MKKNNSSGGSACCPLSKNQEIKLTIDDLGNEGEGIGHYEGYAVFVKNALPGDEITAGIMKVKKNYAYARLISIDNPSPDRIQPACTIAERCGGCTLQHMSYEAQLAYKENKIKNCLMRIGGYDAAYLDDIKEPLIGMDEPYNYRNKAQFPVQKDNAGNIVTGFYAGRTHSIIPADTCNIQMPESNMIVSIVRDWMKEHDIEPYDETSHKGLIRHILTRIGKATGEIMVCLVATKKNIPCTKSLVDSLIKINGMKSICINVNPDKTNKILGDKVYSVYGPLYIEDLIGDIRYRISPLSFYQVNPSQTVKLYNTALEYAGLTGNEVVWDLYCGIGTISLFLARKAKKVLGVEIVPEAIGDAKVNAKINGIENAVFVVGKAEEVAEDVRNNSEKLNNAYNLNNSNNLPEINEAELIAPGRKEFEEIKCDTDYGYDDNMRDDNITGIKALEDRNNIRDQREEKYQDMLDILDMPDNMSVMSDMSDMSDMASPDVVDVSDVSNVSDMASPDVVVIDPPRKGCEGALIETIVRAEPERVVYVSCDPATLARDLKIFRENGYELVRYRGCDMFGMTGHVESITLLERVSNRKADTKVHISSEQLLAGNAENSPVDVVIDELDIQITAGRKELTASQKKRLKAYWNMLQDMEK